MSNAGIPGFWPHVAMYLGTLEEMDREFSDLPVEGSESFSSFLEESMPEAWKALKGRDERGCALRVIEALRPGIVLTSLEESANHLHMSSLLCMEPPSPHLVTLLALCVPDRHICQDQHRALIEGRYPELPVSLEDSASHLHLGAFLCF